jgi:hypothetical protein
MERNAAPGATDVRPAPPTGGPDDAGTMAFSSEPAEATEAMEAVDDWKLAEHLAPVDQLLRELSKIEPPDQCPDGLCKRTLDRCRTAIIGG